MRKLIAGLAALLLAGFHTPLMAQAGTGQAPVATAAPVPTTPPPPTSDVSPGYILGVHDTIGVLVLGRSDFTTQATVQEDGTISLPLIGSVSASGQSLLQLKAVIEQRLKAGGYFRQPEVSIVLITPISRYATILGEVASPGLVPLDREFRLSELVARAGGARTGADTLTVTLPDNQIREYSLRAITTSASPDPVIAPGTKVFVKPAPIYYVYGQVGSAGAFGLEPGMTLRNAIARAGGPSQIGTLKKVKVYRGDQTINKPDLNIRVEPGDTIFVGEKLF